MTNNVQKTNVTIGLSSPLKGNLETNWNGRKVQIVSSGVSSALAGGAAATAAFLGGPFAAIIALAATALTALTVFISSLVVKPRTVTVLPQPEITKLAQETVESTSQQIEVQVEGKSELEETAILETQVSVTKEETSVVVAEQASKKGFVQNAITYAKENPYKTALGAAAFVCAGAAAAKFATANPPLNEMLAKFGLRPIQDGKNLIAPPPSFSGSASKLGRFALSDASKVASGVSQTPIWQTLSSFEALQSLFKPKTPSSLETLQSFFIKPKTRTLSQLETDFSQAVKDNAKPVLEALSSTHSYKKLVKPTVDGAIEFLSEQTKNNGSIASALNQTKTAVDFVSDHSSIVAIPTATLLALKIKVIAKAVLSVFTGFVSWTLRRRMPMTVGGGVVGAMIGADLTHGVGPAARPYNAAMKSLNTVANFKNSPLAEVAKSVRKTIASCAKHPVCAPTVGAAVGAATGFGLSKAASGIASKLTGLFAPAAVVVEPAAAADLDLDPPFDPAAAAVEMAARANAAADEALAAEQAAEAAAAQVLNAALLGL